MIRLIVLALIISEMAFALPSWQSRRGSAKWQIFKWEMDIGHTQVEYIETHETQNPLDLRFVQRGIRARGLVEWMIIPRWLWVGGSIDKIFPNSSEVKQMSFVSESCCEMKTTNSKGHIGLWLPSSRPVNLSLIAEYFTSKVQTSSPEFGYAKRSNWQYGAQIDITSYSGQTFYACWFPWGPDEYLEMRAGLQFKLSGAGNRYPFSLFNSGILINIDYRRIMLDFNSPVTIDIDRREYTASLGIRF